MRYTLLSLTLLILGCGGGEQDASEEETVFDPMVNTIDKAKEVDDAALKHKEAMDKRLQEMEGTDDD